MPEIRKKPPSLQRLEETIEELRNRVLVLEQGLARVETDHTGVSLAQNPRHPETASRNRSRRSSVEAADRDEVASVLNSLANGRRDFDILTRNANQTEISDGIATAYPSIVLPASSDATPTEWRKRLLVDVLREMPTTSTIREGVELFTLHCLWQIHSICIHQLLAEVTEFDNVRKTINVYLVDPAWLALLLHVSTPPVLVRLMLR